MLEPVRSGEADMVIGSRLHPAAKSKFRFHRRSGNQLFLWLLQISFGVKLTDLLSGYRVFSRRLVKGIVLMGGGFETEAEMTIKALQHGFVITEVPVDLGFRPEGSHSKIRVLHDGFAILNTILMLMRDHKPLTFFGSLGLGLIVLGLIPGTVVILEYLQTGLVPRPAFGPIGGRAGSMWRARDRGGVYPAHDRPPLSGTGPATAGAGG